MGEMIRFPKAGSASEVAGYLAIASNPKGAVVVLQEWWGLNEQIKATCDRFAEEGFTALAPDLYQGRVTQDPDEASHMMDGLDWGGAAHEDARGAVKYLKSETERKTAIMGFCMGGALTVIGAVHVPECDAAVCYYGIPPADAADPKNIAVPFQGHFASEDDWCSPEAVDALKKATSGLKTPVEIYSYEGKQHGFFNNTVAAYDEEAAEESWTRTIEFLNTHLKD